ncbi:LacI family DNA-binding transcriptional regulator [Salipiger aestuarii]|uniref:LacI family transcriptional regulator n=1 Tax=Salipiger aestuarii TaxID=568098 RepID=A0A327YR45_9RHOB|nr:LacI family DNA-binding transcriptional regulator [Salipiger aestuarii]EIE50657.1 LacI family transcription regulator [Citreicella sp. 357]KAA8612970.1 LacI family transcriptional regulator [Salipiger aestuarii]KAB2543749.1 LacI family transcriptional regulator [Salipiger aestuarii]RAK23001.1 LacI family transcriptional regulator [Salipiger aestuarii]
MNLRQLAAQLGLSQTTVSRALNGYPEVSEATRRRVNEAALATGYTPNPRARGLATGRAMAIGHVIPISTSHEMMNPVFGDFIAGASETYLAAGYDMTLTLSGDADEADNYRRLKAKGNVDGIIVHGPRISDGRIPFLTGLGMPFVVHGRASQTRQPYSWIDMDNTGAFCRAASFLLDLGHRRIALLNGLETMDFAHRRELGYLKALAARGVAPDPALIRGEEMTEPYGYRAARDMLALETPPTAFLVSSLISAIGVRRAIHDAGLRMGHDVSVLSHDDDFSYLSNGRDLPLFTATRSPVREAGRLAAEMLLRRIADPGLPPETRVLEAQLIIGDSTGPAPSRPRQVPA